MDGLLVSGTIPSPYVVVISRSNDGDSVISRVRSGVDKGLSEAGAVTAGMGSISTRLGLGHCRPGGVMGLREMV